MFRITRKTIAEFGGTAPESAEACQQALLHRKETWDSLACNPNLTSTTWKRLWGTGKPSASVAKTLAGRELPRELRAIVIANETRSSVLGVFIEHNVLDEDEQNALLDKQRACDELLKQPWFLPGLRKRAAIIAGGASLLHELAYSPIERFTAGEVEDLLTNTYRWTGFLSRPSAQNARSLRVLFGRRPEAGRGLLKGTAPRSEMLTALAGSANLTDEQATTIAKIDGDISTLSSTEADELRYCLMALVANPRCPLRVVRALTATFPLNRDISQSASRRLDKDAVVGPLSEIDDHDQIEWLLNRACPASGSFGYRQGRPVELLELSGNTNLDQSQKDRLGKALAEDIEPELLSLHPELGMAPAKQSRTAKAEPSLPQWYVQAMEFASKRLGGDPQKWETLIGLVDDYEGNFEELVELAEAL